MMNSFWWGHDSDPKKGIKWEAWDSLCKHKSDGGMSFRNLYVFNVAMLGKLGWRLLNNPDSLVSRILKAKYFPSTDFLSAQLGYNPSYTWRSIHEARDLIRRGTRWKVGGGESVRIWDCPWVDNDNSFLISTAPVPTFEDMVVNDLFIPGTRVWDRELIDEVFNPADRDAILKTTPAPMGCEDRLIWHFAANGKYSVKTAYILAMRLINNGPPHADSPWQKIWKCQAPPKVKSCFWRICKGWIPVTTKLIRRGIQIPALCPNCAAQTETLWHAFVDCPFVKECWIECGLWSDIDNLIIEVEDHSDLFMRLIHQYSDEKLAILMSVAWQIWKARNALVWDHKRTSASWNVHSALVYLEEWKAIRGRLPDENRTTICTKWHAPPPSVMKLNVDAGFFQESMLTGIGMVLRDDRGEIVVGRSMLHTGLMKIDEGEAWGALEALNWVSNMGLPRVDIELDAKRVVDAYKNPEVNDTTFGNFIGRGKEIIHSKPNFKLSWISRNANTMAHSFARNSRYFESPHCWVEPPPFVDDLLDRCLECT